jgi:hypothetical protein
MGADARVERVSASVDRRARSVWVVLALCMMIFVSLCALVGNGVSTFLTTVTVQRPAWLEPLANSQLIVRRNHQVAPVSVAERTDLQEGDLAETGTTGSALLTLADGSTVRLYFDSALRLERQRISRFFGNSRETILNVTKGTFLVATASLGESHASSFLIASGAALVEVMPNSKVRVRAGSGSEALLVTVDEGQASVKLGEADISLEPRQQARASGGALVGPQPAEEELIRNGTLIEEPTSGAELRENGGLGIAAWEPVTTQTDPPIADPGVVELVTETVRLQETRAVRFVRGSEDSRYTQVGMRQVINKPAEFLRTIELDVTAKVVLQTIAAPGPRADLFPLTVRVVYRDSDGEQHAWTHNFYHTGDPLAIANATRVQLGTWTTVQRLAIKSDTQGQDMQVLEAIEIYGFGRGFESWVTGISLIAR